MFIVKATWTPVIFSFWRRLFFFFPSTFWPVFFLCIKNDMLVNLKPSSVKAKIRSDPTGLVICGWSPNDDHYEVQRTQVWWAQLSTGRVPPRGSRFMSGWVIILRERQAHNGWPAIKTSDTAHVCVNTEGRCLPLNLVPGQFPRGTGVGLRRQRRFRLHCLCGRQCGGIRIWQPLWVASPPPKAISLLFGKRNFFGVRAVVPS